ncbi:MAG: hypothetical protein AAF771_09930 [Pseudomonadota bacterium]
MPSDLPKFGNIDAAQAAHDNARRRLFDLITALDTRELESVAAYVEGVVNGHENPAIAAWLSGVADPRVQSIAEIAATLPDEQVDQLLFAAEDAYDGARRA